MQDISPVAIFDNEASDTISHVARLSEPQLEKLFDFFCHAPLFKWNESNNDCEDRADAVCRLLDAWQIPNAKGWIFGGGMLAKGQGQLIKEWKYHVAAIVPVQSGTGIQYYVLDPSLLKRSALLHEWATQVSSVPYCYYQIKASSQYIFNHEGIRPDNWHERNKQNYKWMVQGLAGINGVSQSGKASLCFNKQRIHRTHLRFMQLFRQNPLAGQS